MRPLSNPTGRSLIETMIFSKGQRTPSEVQFDEEVMKKVSLLMDHYNLAGKHRNGNALALHLAFDFVPGFQYEKKRGTKSKWHGAARGYLFADVTRIREKNRGKSITWATKTLATKEPWKSFTRGEKHSGESLRKQYYQVPDNDKWSKLAIKQMRLCIERGRESEWEKVVKDIVKICSD